MLSQNGIAEQFNHIIIELAQAMILACNFPKDLWHEAGNHATYIRNKSFTHAIKGKTPKRICSPIWVLNEAHQSKLDPKPHKMMFIRFIDGPHAIKYYNVRTHHVSTTQNYHFTHAPPDIQFEGEEENNRDQIELVMHCENLKCKHPEGDSPPIERNLRPRKPVNYRLLDDLLLAYDPSLELTALASEDPEEES